MSKFISNIHMCLECKMENKIFWNETKFTEATIEGVEKPVDPENIWTILERVSNAKSDTMDEFFRKYVVGAFYTIFLRYFAGSLFEIVLTIICFVLTCRHLDAWVVNPFRAILLFRLFEGRKEGMKSLWSRRRIFQIDICWRWGEHSEHWLSDAVQHSKSQNFRTYWLWWSTGCCRKVR